MSSLALCLVCVCACVCGRETERTNFIACREGEQRVECCSTQGGKEGGRERANFIAHKRRERAENKIAAHMLY